MKKYNKTPRLAKLLFLAAKSRHGEPVNYDRVLLYKDEQDENYLTDDLVQRCIDSNRHRRDLYGEPKTTNNIYKDMLKIRHELLDKPRRVYMTDFSEIISHVRGVASTLETDAAYAGGWDDNGAGRLRDQIYIFECGLAGVLPSHWEKYKQEIEAKRDPDRAAYERYKKKYG